MPALFDAASRALIITAFVAMMMLAVEYLSVLSRGTLQRVLSGRKTQYVAAVLLGALPGCLGPFTVVALYAHRVLPLGAVVGAMIATSGDEAFVMLSLFPVTALWLTAGLAVVGLAVGPLVDTLLGQRWAGGPCPDLVLHPEDVRRFFGVREIVRRWERPTPSRLILTLGIVTFLALLVTGRVGPGEWGWERITLASLGTLGGFVIITVPDHFLKEHLWTHVALKHVPRIFLWTFGVLACLALLDRLIDLTDFVRGNVWATLGIAVTVGIIPQSGPHLVFVSLFSQGAIPLSVLAASSIVQDGHGMLPLLAESRTDFIQVKAINVAVGLAWGAVLLLAGV